MNAMLTHVTFISFYSTAMYTSETSCDNIWQYRYPGSPYRNIGMQHVCQLRHHRKYKK
jgi:hypothetical protein